MAYLIFFLSIINVLGCSPGSDSSKPKPLLINGAGASFPYILYAKWFMEYRKEDPSVVINYRSIGSGGGIRQFIAGTTDFGATDVPMSKDNIKKTKREFVHIPSVLSAVVVSYNLPSLKDKTMKLNADVLGEIYIGNITKWDHEKLRKLNPGIKLPSKDILPIYRSDGSGTTAIFTEYLAKFSAKWLQTVGKGKSVAFPTGIGAKGNEGVMGFMRKTPGALAYMGMGYALHRKQPTALIQNSKGHFVKASEMSVKQAAEETLKKHKNIFHSMAGVGGRTAYPLSSYTYLLVYKKMFGKKGKAIKNFLNWQLTKGQSFCKKLYYVPLPSLVIPRIQSRVQSIQVEGE